MLALSIRSGLLFYTTFLIFADALAIYFAVDTFGLIKKAQLSSATAGESKVPANIDREFQAGLPKTASDFRTIARNQLILKTESTHPPIMFIDLAPLNKNESELRFFDEVTKNLPHGERTLVISHFHRNQIATNTLADHLTYNTSLPAILCTEISPNFDLIPYAGNIGVELSYRARLFLEAQQQNYQRIVFLLPPEQIEIWKDIANETMPGIVSSQVPLEL